MLPNPFVVEALYEALVQQLQKLYRSPSNLRAIHIVDMNPELLPSLVSHFNKGVSQADPQGALIAYLDRDSIDDSIREAMPPLIPPKIEHVHKIQQSRDVETWGINRRESQRDRRYSDADSRSDHTASDDGTRDTINKKNHKKRVFTSKKHKPPPGKATTGEHVTVHTRKSNPLDCFKSGKSSTKHEITIEHPHYDSTERIPSLLPNGLSGGYDAKGSRDNGGFTDANRSPMSSMSHRGPSSMVNHGHQPDRISRDLHQPDLISRDLHQPERISRDHQVDRMSRDHQVDRMSRDHQVDRMSRDHQVDRMPRTNEHSDGPSRDVYMTARTRDAYPTERRPHDVYQVNRMPHDVHQTDRRDIYQTDRTRDSYQSDRLLAMPMSGTLERQNRVSFK